MSTDDFEPKAFVVRSPRPGPADVPGTVPRENRAALLQGFLDRPELPGDDDDESTRETEYFFQMQDGDDPESHAVAEHAWMMFLQPNQAMTFTGTADELHRHLRPLLDWATMTLVVLEPEPGRFTYRRVTEEQLNSMWPGWRAAMDELDQ